MAENEMKCPECGGKMERSRECGVPVCTGCGHHLGLARCYCGWAADGGDGRDQLIEMGECLDDDY